MRRNPAPPTSPLADVSSPRTVPTPMRHVPTLAARITDPCAPDVSSCRRLRPPIGTDATTATRVQILPPVFLRLQTFSVGEGVGMFARDSAPSPTPLPAESSRDRSPHKQRCQRGDTCSFLRPSDLEQGRETPLKAVPSPSRPSESHRKTELTPSAVPHALRPRDRSDEIQSGGLPIADPPQRLLFTR